MTGPEEATKGIVAVFDIFGYFDQTLQGADILSASDHHQKYKVFMPDWFNGSPCPAEWYNVLPHLREQPLTKPELGTPLTPKKSRRT